MNMSHTFQISLEALDFLRLRVQDPVVRTALWHPDTTTAVSRQTINPRIGIVLSSEEQSRLVDNLLDLLSSIGIAEDGEPNNIGIYVENLINIFDSVE